VKLKGDDGFEGIHRIIDSENSASANKMTIAGVPYYLETGTAVVMQPVNGDVLTLSGTVLRPTAARMSATELILVGIPLDPALMSFEDWSSLPGIGASLATEIMRYSQKNGGIASIEELIVLPGVGEGTLRRIRPLSRK
jgi:competence protein ComEA